MIFDSLADAIAKHAKLIVALWIAILLVSVPFALKSGDVMKYDINDMAAEDSESIQGMTVMGQYYPSGSVDVSSVPIIVIKYSTAEEKLLSQDFVGYLSDHASEYVDASGRQKLSSRAPFVSMGAQEKEGLDGGIFLVGAVYDTSFEGNVTDDTPALREFISQQKGAFDSLNPGFSGVSTYLTGTPAISADMAEGALDDLSRIDPFTVLLILVLVGLFFRSFVTSATPPMTIGFAFVVTLALIYGIGQILNIFFITEMMILVSMMGAGCDYCIFIIARYREGLRSGLGHDKALHEAIVWAGESIATSGASVIIGFGAMSICSISIVSTMGICLALGILIALLAALTLIPAILELVHDRIFWPTTIESFEEGGKATKGWFGWFGRLGERYFEGSSRFSLKHAKAIVIATVLVTVPAAYIMTNAELSYDMVSSMQTGESGEGMDLIGDYANQGMLMPNYVIFESSEPLAEVQSFDASALAPLVAAGMVSQGAAAMMSQMKSLTWSPSFSSMGVDGLCSNISSDPNVAAISGPFVWQSEVAKATQKLISEGISNPTPTQIIDRIVVDSPGTIDLYVSNTIQTIRSAGIDDSITVAAAGSAIDYLVNTLSRSVGGDFVNSSDGNGSVEYITVTYSTVDAAMSPESMKTIDRSERSIDAFMDANPVLESKWVTGSAAVMYDISKAVGAEFDKIEIIVVILIIILLFVVMRSYLIPLRSVLTILMSICWTMAITHILFTDVLGASVMWLIPMILLVICLGLGMDYDILLTTRIKENVIKGMSNDDAIHHAVTHTGSVITICGLIMGGAFGTLMLSSMLMMQQFGFALCFAILCDALIVRTYIVPAIMHLLGRWNWVGPKFMRRGSD